ncbi:hypothetical protein Syun_020593 [Stephania yunnanensis]|uniref:RING-type domain-containing protein n=1 Tax=Stephania yunnanensis TaxID=152371 RepID=A0AAP0IE64_9MAGN
MSHKAVHIATQVMVMAIVISVVLLFLGIGVLVLIHLCIVGRAFRRGFGSTSANSNSGNTHDVRVVENGLSINRMSVDDLKKLPSFDFQVGEKGSSPVDCAVCLENFSMGDRCRLLPLCKHSFHARCVDSWLLKTPICPICRTSTAEFKGGKKVLLGDGSGQQQSGLELRSNQTVVAAIDGLDH